MYYSTLVLSGGSLHTLTYIGAINYLHEKNIAKHIKTVIGTSCGAIIGLLFALGLRERELVNVFRSFLERHTAGTPDFDNIFNIFYTLGMDDGACLRQCLREAIQAKFGQQDLTFIELAKKTGVNLLICACRVCDLTETVFDVETTPNLSVVSAVLASSAIPIIFKPVAINGELYLDGALSVNCPVKFVHPSQLGDTLCFRIVEVDEPTRVLSSSTPNLASFMFSLLINSINRLNKNNLSITTPVKYINFPPIKSSNPDFCTNRFCFDLRTMKFKVDMEDVTEIFTRGYELAKLELELTPSL
jgi:NTE family protein